MTEAPDPEEPTRPSWATTAAEFVSARMELFALEAREVGVGVARKAVLAVVIAGCAVIAWLAVVVGLVGWIAAAQDTVAWYFVAFGAAVLHLLVAGIAWLALRQPSSPAFPLLKEELNRDREWLHSLKSKS